MIKIVSFICLFTLSSCFVQRHGKLKGRAQNIKEGAVISTKNGFYHIININAWNKDIDGKSIVVKYDTLYCYPIKPINNNKKTVGAIQSNGTNERCLINVLFYKKKLGFIWSELEEN